MIEYIQKIKGVQMRLNKYIAHSGIVSRRKADELTAAGKVTVNGAVMTQPGYDVQPGDIVMVEGKLAQADEKLCYYALNKPAGYVTTASDEKGRPTVLSLLTDVDVRVYPVGRLDFDTSGLLILTNDGELANRVMHPKGEVKKTYLARIGGRLTPQQLDMLRSGVQIDIPLYGADKGKTKKYRTRPAEVEVLDENASQSVVQIVISEGKNRQVRKMFAAAGHRVLALERVAIGNVKLGRTKPGNYRRLTAAEIEELRNS